MEACALNVAEKPLETQRTEEGCAARDFHRLFHGPDG